MTTTQMMAPLEEEPKRVQKRSEATHLGKSLTEGHLATAKMHCVPTTLCQLVGLEAVGDICRRHKVEITAHGSLVRRLIRQPDANIFDLVPFLSDVDLVHNGTGEQTEAIRLSLLTDVPFAESLRIELRDRKAADFFRSVAAHSGIIPAHTLRLASSGGGILDPWGGIEDIQQLKFRYIKNGFFTDSPLYRLGQDINALSALAYFRTVLESAAPLEEQPGLDAAVSVIDETTTSSDALSLVCGNPLLCARLIYSLQALRAAAPLLLTLESPTYSRLSLDRLQSYFSVYPLLTDAFSSVFSPFTAYGESISTSAHLAGGLFRLPYRLTQHWQIDAEAAREVMMSTVDAYRASSAARSVTRSLEQPTTVDDGLVVLAASPRIAIRSGKASSSRYATVPNTTQDAPSPTGTHEFVHFMVTLAPAEVGLSLGSDSLSIIAAIYEGDTVRWVTTLPACCTLRTIDSVTFLFIRGNLGDLCEVIVNGGLQFFVMAWSGRESRLVRA